MSQPPPPKPHLTANQPTNQTATPALRQPWSNVPHPDAPDALLAVTYTDTKAPTCRCFDRYIRLRIPTIIAASLIYGALVSTATGVMIWTLTHLVIHRFQNTPWFSVIGTSFAGNTAVAFAFISCGVGLAWLTYHHPRAFSKTLDGRQLLSDGKQTTYQFIPTGALDKNSPRHHITGKQKHFRWRDLASIRLENGDLFLLTRLPNRVWFVPRETFPDPATMQRFAAAVTALWKAGGNPDALPPDAAKFAPDAAPEMPG